MKSAQIFFAAAILILLIVPFAIERVAAMDIRKNGIESKVAQDYMQFYQDTIRVSDIEATKITSTGFFDRITIGGGVQLINDYSMGDDLKLVGPPEALNALGISNGEGDLGLHFQRPILLNEPIQVYLNLAAHHVGKLKITCSSSFGKIRFQPLCTKTPITGKFVTVDGMINSDEPVQVDVENLYWFTNHHLMDEQLNPVRLTGEVTKLTSRSNSYNRINTDQVTIEETTFSNNLPSGETYRMNGRNIRFSYYNNNNEVTLDDYQLNIVPDTLVVPRSARVETRLTVNGKVETLDGLVHVIRE